MDDEELFGINEPSHLKKSKKNYKEKKGTTFGSAFTIANTTIGAGLLGLPFLVATAGLVLGVVLLVGFGLVANLSLRYLHMDTLLSGEASYEDVGYSAVGNWGTVAVIICVIGINFGSQVSYIILIGDFLHPIMEDIGDNDDAFWKKRIFLQLIVTCGIIIPLCLMPSVTDLRFISLASLIVAYLFIGTVIYRFAADYDDRDSQSLGTIEYATFSVDLLRTLGVPVFAYSAHTILVPVTSEMKDNRFSNVVTSINLANGCCIVSFVICGVFGYLAFLDTTEGNILNNYGDNGLLINIVRGMMTLVICFTYPLCIIPLRVSLDNLLFSTFTCSNPDGSVWKTRSGPITAIHSATEEELLMGTEEEPSKVFFTVKLPSLSPDPEDDGYDPEKCGCCYLHSYNVTAGVVRFVIETVVVVLLTFILAAAIPNVERVFAFVGGTFSACTSFIFPGFFYYSLRHRDHKGKAIKNVGGLFLVGLGLFMLVLTVVVNILDFV